MIIKSITLNNYRLYGGDNTIVFNNKEDKNICLISGIHVVDESDGKME